MNRLLGVLAMVAVLYGALMYAGENARSPDNQQTLARFLGFYGVLTLGAGVLILSGGIDLSLGSVVGLGAVCFAKLLLWRFPPEQAALIVVAGGAVIGLCHGLLVTKLKLQPFLVTLCGLFIYRGLARWIARQASMGTNVEIDDLIADDPGLRDRLDADPDLYTRLSDQLELLNLKTETLRRRMVSGTPLPVPNQFLLLLLVGVLIVVLQGTAFARRRRGWALALSGLLLLGWAGVWYWSGLDTLHRPMTWPTPATVADLYRQTRWGLPNQFLLLLGIAVVVGAALHFTRYGRYLYAIGANEEAARYAGVATDRHKIGAYVLCSALGGLGSVLFILDNRTVNPTSAGSLLELYAITGAVLGGCSLRGGEGSAVGMLLGAAMLPLLRQLCSFTKVADVMEYVVIGLALLLGTIADELIRRGQVRRLFAFLGRPFRRAPAPAAPP
jgi:ribose transport system permease protein